MSGTVRSLLFLFSSRRRHTRGALVTGVQTCALPIYGFAGEPTALLGRALALKPKEPFALTLAGAAALERRDYDQAISYWQQLHELLPSDSDAARAVNDSIERASVQRAQNTTSDKLGVEQPS